MGKGRGGEVGRREKARSCCERWCCFLVGRKVEGRMVVGGQKFRERISRESPSIHSSEIMRPVTTRVFSTCVRWRRRRRRRLLLSQV